MIPVYKITTDSNGNEYRRAMTLPDDVWQRVVERGATASERFELREEKENKVIAIIKEIAKEERVEEKSISEMDITELKALAKERKIAGSHLIKTREKLIEVLSK